MPKLQEFGGYLKEQNRATEFTKSVITKYKLKLIIVYRISEYNENKKEINKKIEAMLKVKIKLLNKFKIKKIRIMNGSIKNATNSVRHMESMIGKQRMQMK